MDAGVARRAAARLLHASIEGASAARGRMREPRGSEALGVPREWNVVCQVCLRLLPHSKVGFMGFRQ